MLKIPKSYKIFFAFLTFGLLVANVFGSNFHRFHTSLTRIEFNREEKIFEISIRLFTHDLALLLEKRGGKRLDLEKSTEADKLIFDYLKENFVLTDKRGAVKTLRWIGKEADADSVKVYVETDSAETMENYTLKNTVFFEFFHEQTNIVVCRYDGVKADLLFKVGDKTKPIVSSKTAKDESR